MAATTQAQRQAEVLAAGYNGPLTDAAINQAYANAATSSDLAASGISNSPSSGPSQTVSNNVAQSSVQQLGAQVNSLLGAIASGNKAAFDEAVRQFNATFGLDEKKFSEAVRQFNIGVPISEANLTGQYGGAPTLAAQAQNAGLYGMYGTPTAGQSTLAAQNQAYTQQMGMINSAAALQANPFRQQQALGQMNRLLGGQGVAGFTAPNQVAGVGVAGGNTQGGMGYLQAMVDDIRDPTANTASMNQIMQGIPTPNKLNSNEFLRAAPSTQNMVLQGMQEKYGLDPADSLRQIQATLPQFQAPTTFGAVKR